MFKLNLLLDYINYFINNYVYNFLSLSYFYFLFIFYLHVVLSIWARAAGPRTRLDHISKISWKQYVIMLIFYFILILLLIVIF